MKIRPRQLITSFGILVVLLVTTNCTDKKNDNQSSESILGFNSVTLDKSQGINIGESDGIWAVDQTNPWVVYRIRLDPLKDYPTDTFQITKDPDLDYIAWPSPANPRGFKPGSRTYVSEWGLLVARTGKQTDSAGPALWGLYLMDPLKKEATLLQKAGGLLLNAGGDPARASPFAYRVKSGNSFYKFAAVAYATDQSTASSTRMRIERFWFNETTQRFIRVQPIEWNAPLASNQERRFTYSGFLYPDDDNCSDTSPAGSVCSPKYMAMAYRQSIVVGVNLNVGTYPPVPFTTNSTPLAGVPVSPANQAFSSTSHPTQTPCTGPNGSINSEVYSGAGDPEIAGPGGAPYIFKSWNLCSAGRMFNSYDKVNQVVYAVSQKTPTANSRVTVYRRECFVSTPDCNPSAANPKSKSFTDLGSNIGPTSDLGNGCVAILGLEGGPDDNEPLTSVMTACLRDPNDLNRGLVVSKIKALKGNFYNYNDFTGTSLYTREIRVLFDFTTRKYDSIKSASMSWIQKLGYAATPRGLIMDYRCFKKGANPPDSAFARLAIPDAGSVVNLPACGGDGISQVELRIRRDAAFAGARFTRFETISIKATK